MTAGITLSLGYDTERPHSSWATTEQGHRLRLRQLDLVERLGAMLDELEAPRTHFLLGDYLARCAERVPGTRLRSIYDRSNPLVDLQQHTYSHVCVRRIARREGDEIVSSEQFGADVRRASRVIREILGVQPCGLRTPKGYAEDLSSMPEVVGELARAGIRYVSSDLRSQPDGATENFEGRLSRERQPHTYAGIGFAGIVELPSHGQQDVIFTRSIAERVHGGAPAEGAEILAHYTGLFDQAERLAAGGRDVHIGLCLHPFAVMEYDPTLEIQRAIVERARERGVEVVSYHEAARRTLASASRSEDLATR